MKSQGGGYARSNMVSFRFDKPVQRSRAGMTLIEVLVGFGIVSVLMALGLSAIQQARDSAKRIACGNNLRQISLAVIQFEGVNRQLPPGREASSGTNRPFRGWQVPILPYLEQNQLFIQSENAYRTSPYPYDVSVHTPFARAVAVYGCPSDNRVRSPFPAEVLGGSRVVGLSSYLGVSGLDHRDRYGVLIPGRSVKLGEIADGLSNTLLCGERPPSKNGNLGWWYTGAGQDYLGNSDMFMGVEEIDAGLSKETTSWFCSGPYGFSHGTLERPCDVLKFWSFHRGGANFAFVDGHVVFLTYNNSVLRDLATKASP